LIALGIDAGGTKTIFSLCDGDGRVLCAVHRPSIALARLGEDAQREALLEGVQAALGEAGLPPGPPLGLSAVCFGAPCWGESQAGDQAMERSMGRIFGDTPWVL